MSKQRTVLNAGNLVFLETMYEEQVEQGDELINPLNEFFQSLDSNIDNRQASVKTTPHIPVRKKFRDYMLHKTDVVATKEVGSPQNKHDSVINLIESYRLRGHQIANLDPLGRSIRIEIIELTLQAHGLDEADLDTKFSLPNINEGQPTALRNVVSLLKKVYCSNIGYEYNYIMGTSIKNWMQEEIRATRVELSSEEKIHIFERIIAAEGLEKYLHTKYVGQKRFSLEGGDSLLVALDSIIKDGCLTGYKDMIIGMAHRGRLNVLINIFGKNPADLIGEFEGKNYDENVELSDSGDVKYHQGFANDVKYGDNEMHISLAFNPSHLQIVYPVIEGSVRARQDMRNDNSGNQVIPLIIHGDAAFAGQGVNMETLNMVETRGYSTKGTIHIVINNQIGFTTSSAKDVRSTFYCTDLAKMINAPIIHVNGDDPEAVLNVARIAVKFRNIFHRDIVIDLFCYRRHGHNEGDEPSVTQPQMYSIIKKLPTVCTIYGNKLIAEKVLTQAEIDVMRANYLNTLESNKCVAKNITQIPKESSTRARERYWKELLKNKAGIPYADTTYPLQDLVAVAIQLNTVPANFTLHPLVKRILQDRIKMANGELMLDWGAAENLAYAALMKEGFGVRVSGQDCGRGTFFHRHAVLHDSKTGESILPLRQFETEKCKCLVIDSLLSEEAVLAFEYGYTTTNPSTLVVWEAQFGDFANGAQVVIDQFISSGQLKWNRLCGLVMLLPHGYEGQGPEHSSARLERYLQLCAEDNMMVVVPTLPAQIFHLLRMQMKRNTRKPLIVMSPKSLLRHPEAVSSMQDLAEGGFEAIIDDHTIKNKKQASRVKRIVVCCGKVYYDLHASRNKNEVKDLAIVRIEQLYPFPKDKFEAIITKYNNATIVIWCQEEPKNQGAWFSIRHRLEVSVQNEFTLNYVGRDFSASTAVGYARLHTIQQIKLVNEALGIN